MLHSDKPGRGACARGPSFTARSPLTKCFQAIYLITQNKNNISALSLKLKNPLLQGEVVMGPLARQELEEAACNGQIILLSMDQTDLGDRMAVLMVCVRVGDRSLPLAWIAEEGAATIGFEGQRIVLERIGGWVPAGPAVMLSADRFYPSAALFEWLHRHGWRYRLRLKGNLLADPGHGDETTTGALAREVKERYLPQVRLFAEGVLTNLGILHEASQEEPWIVAMEGTPTRARRCSITVLAGRSSRRSPTSRAAASISSPGVVSRNPRKFRQPNASPSTIASKSMSFPSLRNV
jgi:hypothetical protein